VLFIHRLINQVGRLPFGAVIQSPDKYPRHLLAENGWLQMCLTKDNHYELLEFILVGYQEPETCPQASPDV
jgi:hypothetical protein